MKHARFNRHLYRRAAKVVIKVHDDFPLYVPPPKPRDFSTEHFEEDNE
ncbi:MAG: hypothetical protein ACXADS_13815 [Candidatus Thorarchaeota archaeon]